ncbi:accessory gland protein Acp29AB-like [Drosophila sulfurigaster albostrigata]|uniref:accessory gland protein Acp29AB-like n=1 Tax=Drosophila sulfurigaster albostrigata TaxID=89887 RepID=UPI002D21CF56|nr:accessory gland protein Acp29AB-like [Drosophila sulfurigaster albostrigata]
MKSILIGLIISALLEIGTSQTCQKSNEMDETCGRYCYTIVKQLLDHTKSLEKQVNVQESELNKALLEKFENIEQQLRTLQEDLTEVKKKSLQRRESEFRRFYEKIGSKYFYIEKDKKMNWFSAVQRCRELDGHLINKNCFYLIDTKVYDYYWVILTELPAVPTSCYSKARTGQTQITTAIDDCNKLNWFICELNEN